MCTSLFGFLRCGEFTVPSQSEYDPSTHLSLNDIAIDSAGSPSLIQVSIKQSKTDPFRKGVQLFLAKTGKNICPITAIMPYLALRGPKQGHYSFIKEELSHTTRFYHLAAYNSSASRLRRQPVCSPQF